MRALVLGAVIVLSALRAQEQQEPTLEAELEALVATTNAQDSFRALCRVTDSAGEVTEVELLYTAPDLGGMRASGAVELELYVVGRTLYMHSEGRWTKYELEDLVAIEVLEDAFGSDGDLAAGVVFSCAAGEDGGSFSVASVPVRHARMLDWLGMFQRSSSDVEIDGDDLLLERGVAHFRLSRKTGFLEEFRIQVEEKLCTVQLIELTTDFAFELPEGAKSAHEDIQGALGMNHIMRTQLRASGYARVLSLVRREEVEWNARARDLWYQFMVALHEQWIDAHVSLDPWRDRIDQFARRLSDRLEESPESRAALKTESDENEEQLRRSLGSFGEKYRAELPPLEAGDEAEYLVDVEREVIEKLVGDLIATPVLDYFHEQVEAVLGD
jgi:hypothetical protein